MELWCPFAIRNEAPVTGGSFFPVAPKGVLHTTESDRFYPNPNNYFGHSSYPHFTVDQDGTVYQHIQMDRAARAAKNESGGVETNRARLWQIEFVGRAVETVWPERQVVAGKTLMRWIEYQTGIQKKTLLTRPYPSSYGLSNGLRIPMGDWLEWSGWCAHMHIPENTHGDIGAVDIWDVFLKDALQKEENIVATEADKQAFRQIVREELRAERKLVAAATAHHVWKKDLPELGQVRNALANLKQRQIQILDKLKTLKF